MSQWTAHTRDDSLRIAVRPEGRRGMYQLVPAVPPCPPAWSLYGQDVEWSKFLFRSAALFA